MAIDPVTGLETTEPPSTIGESGAALSGVNVGGSYTGGAAEVLIPDVGLEDARLTTQERVGEEQTALSGRFDQADIDRPTYEAPDPSKLDTIEDASAYQRPEDTVAYQMEQLLNQDSPYMQAAKLRAEEKAQSFGQLGSSMSVGASHRAAIESAMPIAQQDAQTSAKFGMQQQAAENEIGAIEAETELGSALMLQRTALENQQMQLDQSFDLAMSGLDQESQTILADIQGRWQLVTQDSFQRLEAALTEKLNNQSIDAETVSSIRATAGDITQNYQISVEELLKDPDFLQLGSDAIQSTLNNMLATATASIQFIADSSGVNLDVYLDDFETNAQFTAVI